MKRFFTLLIALSMLLCGCSDYIAEQENSKRIYTNITDLTASFADDTTRTYVEDGKYLRWHEDDRITAFYGNTLNQEYKFNGSTGDNSGTFSLVPNGELGTGNTIDHIYALYPYRADTSITDEGVISLTLPTTQSYTKNSFGRGSNTMIAVTKDVEDTFLSFKNACGYLVVKLYGEDVMIKSIVLKGNNNEKIAGAATIISSYECIPQITVSDKGGEEIALICNDAVEIGSTIDTATEFWFSLPETAFSNGFTITIMDVSFKEQIKTTNNKVIIERNCIQPMTAFEFCGIEQPIPNNEIWYTTTDNSLFAPYYSTNVNASITSNIITNAKGVITYDTDVVSLGNYTIAYNNYLESIRLPDSISSISDSAFASTSGLVSIIYPSSSEKIVGNSSWKKVKYLHLNKYNALKNLSIHNYTSLEILDLRGCCPLLNSISFYGNNVKQLVLGEKECLTYLSTGGGYWDVSPLQTLDLSGCPNLETLECSKAKLTELNITKLEKITSIKCNDNQLTNLNLSQKSVLKYLDCSNNKLSTIDLSDCSSLQELTCSYNMLTELNVDNCKDIKYLYCADNQIRVLDISKTYVGGIGTDYYSRPLDCSPMDTLEILYIGSLSGLGKIPYVYPESIRDSNYVPYHTQIIKR